MSTPEWNAPSPLNGSILDPNGPVIGPITGHNVGAVVAATQSASDACRFTPMPRPAVYSRPRHGREPAGIAGGLGGGDYSSNVMAGNGPDHGAVWVENRSV